MMLETMHKLSKYNRQKNMRMFTIDVITGHSLSRLFFLNSSFSCMQTEYLQIQEWSRAEVQEGLVVQLKLKYAHDKPN